MHDVTKSWIKDQFKVKKKKTNNFNVTEYKTVAHIEVSGFIPQLDTGKLPLVKFGCIVKNISKYLKEDIKIVISFTTTHLCETNFSFPLNQNKHIKTN